MTPPTVADTSIASAVVDDDDDSGVHIRVRVLVSHSAHRVLEGAGEKSTADSDGAASDAAHDDEAPAADDFASAMAVDDDSGVNIRVAVSISPSAHHVHETESQRAYDPMQSLLCVPHNTQMLTHVDVTNDDSQSAFTCAISSSLPHKERGKRNDDHTTQYSSCGYASRVTGCGSPV